MMALHQVIQRLLLIGVRLDQPAHAPAEPPPAALVPLIDSIAPAHRTFDQRAVHYGHRYRSGFWAIYLLSAVAVLFAVLPLALGWDSAGHRLHSYAALWALGEVVVIGVVSAIYWRGHRRHWQEQWLDARTTAELCWYLPLIAPLIDFNATAADANWYVRVFDPGQHVRADDVAALCTRNEALARAQLAHAWSDAPFVAGYSRWTIGILEQQRRYHRGIAVKQATLLHRVHVLTSWLFGLTALGALMHLMVHTIWLAVMTTFFPALGASLHGALAQSEAYRLGQASESLAAKLEGAIERIRASLATVGALGDVGSLKASIQDAIALILEEHHDWQRLVRPHRLSLG
jgi:hypothetical protein